MIAVAVVRNYGLEVLGAETRVVALTGGSTLIVDPLERIQHHRWVQVGDVGGFAHLWDINVAIGDVGMETVFGPSGAPPCATTA